MIQFATLALLTTAAILGYILGSLIGFVSLLSFMLFHQLNTLMWSPIGEQHNPLAHLHMMLQVAVIKEPG